MTRKRLTPAGAKDPRFYGDWRLEQHEESGLTFWVRPDTSDVKSIAEVVGRKSYDRYKVGPAPDELWFDLGANIGAFTVWAAARGARVVSFEPDPVSMRIAKLNVKLNKLREQVVFDPRAVTGDDAPAEMTMHVNSARGNYWRNSLYHAWRGGFEIPVETVPLNRLTDGYPFDDGTAPNLKIDVEGAEMSIVETADLDQWGRAVIEWSFDIDRSIRRFKRAVRRLQERYENVRYGKFDETQKEWQPQWFPPTRMIYCW